MAWSFDPSAWTNGVTIPNVANFQSIATDLHTLGANKDAARYGLANASFATLVPQDLPGTAYTVTAGSWAAGTATLTIGAHNIQVGQLVVVASVVPTGYNNGGVEVAVTGVTGTQISYAITSNPGAYTSGGTVTAWGTPANGMLAVDASGNLNFRKSGSFSTLGVGTVTHTGSLTSGVMVVGNGSADVTTLTNPTFTAPTFANSWSNFGSGFTVAGYCKNAVNDLLLCGAITPGTTSAGYVQVFAALPAGFRPASERYATITGLLGGSTATPAFLKMDTSGNISIYNSSAGELFVIDCRLPLY